MSIRLKCTSCQTAFMIADDQAGGRVACPKCGVKQTAAGKALHVPKTPAQAAAAAPAQESSVFVEAEASPRSGRFRKLGSGVVTLLLIGGVAVAVAWPALKRWWNPIPPDPVEAAAVSYLKALAEGDYEAARRLGTVAEPPAIRSFRDVRRLRDGNHAIRGSFAPLAALHARIEQKFEYDPAIGRFKIRDPLGPAAETLDALHDTKAKAEQDELYKKMASGNPNDLFDAAEGLGGAMAKLAEGVLAPRNLIPSYKQLVLDAKPPLPPPAAELALDFAANRESWDPLLGRPFPALKADGPFRHDRALVTATVRDRLASLGDPLTELRLTLVRFRLEGIDTGWKVVGARRPSALPEPPPPVPVPESSATSPPRRSPGEIGP
jgi:predicted Zn finger-like uncharacterized protein